MGWYERVGWVDSCGHGGWHYTPKLSDSMMMVVVMGEASSAGNKWGWYMVVGGSIDVGRFDMFSGANEAEMDAEEYARDWVGFDGVVTRVDGSECASSGVG